MFRFYSLLADIADRCSDRVLEIQSSGQDYVNFSAQVKTCKVLLLWHYTNVCRGYKEEELNMYMEGLHAYNEMKDIGQMLLGRLGKFHNKKVLLTR